MIFDTHSHCYFEKLLSKIEEVHQNMLRAQVTHSVQIGCDISSSLAAIQLAQKYPNWYATVGYHPVDAQNPELSKDRAGGKIITINGTNQILPSNDILPTNEAVEMSLRNLVKKYKNTVVAIGETGLDKHYLSPEKEIQNLELERQYYWFEKQAQMAKDFNLPLVIHSRDARAETIAAIKKFDIKRAVIHCFSEDIAFAEELMEFSEDIYFSFTGILTYPNAHEIQEAAKKIPIHRILVETDAPFLAPQVVRGTLNEPTNTRHILEFLTKIREASWEATEQQIFENSLRFYLLEK